LLAALVLYQFTKDPTQAGLRRVVDESPAAQELLGGTLKRNTLTNALTPRDLDQMIEAWLFILAHYRPFLVSCGKKFARIAAVDASLLKLSLAAFDWAHYREQSGAAKITCVFEWVRGVPTQFVFSAAAKAHDLVAAQQLNWSAHWTYLFDRGYFSFPFLTSVINARGAFCDPAQSRCQLSDRATAGVAEREVARRDQGLDQRLDGTLAGLGAGLAVAPGQLPIDRWQADPRPDDARRPQCFVHRAVVQRTLDD
jgi:hypothetical protein